MSACWYHLNAHEVYRRNQNIQAYPVKYYATNDAMKLIEGFPC